MVEVGNEGCSALRDGTGGRGHDEETCEAS